MDGDGLLARENRQAIKEKVKSITFNLIKKHTGFKGIEVDMEINAHHNYAAREHHYGEDVWVHRKGAIRARDGELGIVPGAMGRASYIVRGLGNPESFYPVPMEQEKMSGKGSGHLHRKRSFTGIVRPIGSTCYSLH